MQLAKRCAELANECSAPTVAEALRALALDYLRRAAMLRGRTNHLDKDAIEQFGPPRQPPYRGSEPRWNPSGGVLLGRTALRPLNYLGLG